MGAIKLLSAMVVVLGRDDGDRLRISQVSESVAAEVFMTSAIARVAAAFAAVAVGAVFVNGAVADRTAVVIRELYAAVAGGRRLLGLSATGAAAMWRQIVMLAANRCECASGDRDDKKMFHFRSFLAVQNRDRRWCVCRERLRPGSNKHQRVAQSAFSASIIGGKNRKVEQIDSTDTAPTTRPLFPNRVSTARNTQKRRNPKKTASGNFPTPLWHRHCT